MTLYDLADLWVISQDKERFHAKAKEEPVFVGDVPKEKKENYSKQLKHDRATEGI